jgi:sigma-B regulation protein RsbU (phosphoserine phosphatase)
MTSPDATRPGMESGGGTDEVRALLIDDQAIVGAAVGRMVEPEKDIRFRFCQDATLAIQEAEAFRPTVILQDLVMPDVDGMMLVRFMRRHPALRDVPLVVLSSKEEAATKAEAFACGANDYLVKLPDRVELLARIRYHSKAYLSLVQRNEAYAALLRSREELAAELARAAEYVLSLLPVPLTAGAITTDWRVVPSARLGGDALGYHWIDERRFAVYLLDVCDHGVGSALLSVSILNVLKSGSLPNVDFRDPSAVLTGLNRAFPMEQHNNLFFTAWYGVYDCQADNLRYASAGHPPALLVGGDGAPRDAGTRNLCVGAMSDAAFVSETTALARPCSLYVFSDGVYEIAMPGGKMWTRKEFCEVLARPPAAWTSELDGLYNHIRRMGGGRTLDDDFSILKVRFHA